MLGPVLTNILTRLQPFVSKPGTVGTVFGVAGVAFAIFFFLKARNAQLSLAQLKAKVISAEQQIEELSVSELNKQLIETQRGKRKLELENCRIKGEAEATIAALRARYETEAELKEANESLSKNLRQTTARVRSLRQVLVKSQIKIEDP